MICYRTLLELFFSFLEDDLFLLFLRSPMLSIHVLSFQQLKALLLILLLMIFFMHSFASFLMKEELTLGEGTFSTLASRTMDCPISSTFFFLHEFTTGLSWNSFSLFPFFFLALLFLKWTELIALSKAFQHMDSELSDGSY